LRKVNRQIVVPAVPIDQLVGPDHPVRIVWDYVCALDLSPLLANIKAVEGVPGRNATDPRILLAVWMWAITNGVGVARTIDQLCRDHNAYRWLAGGVSLNYHTIADFRSSDQIALEGFIEQHVAALLQQGLVELTCVAQDGMRTRASAGSSSFHREATIEECQQRVRQQIEELKRQEGEAPDAVSRRQKAARQRHARERQERLAQARQVAAELGQKQKERLQTHPSEAEQQKGQQRPPRASTTDPEARRMKMADGGTRPGYNLQCATTTQTRIIVAVAATNQGSDGGLLNPTLNQIETTYDERPKQALVDGGYASNQDVEETYARGIEVYTPLKNENKDLLNGKDPYAPKARDGEGMKALRARMGTREAKALYKERAATAEWVNAGMRQRGLTRLTVRGLTKVKKVLVLHALVHNLWQTLRLVVAKKLSLNWTQILCAQPV
jgi:transposase